MHRLVYVILIILVFVSLLAGIRIGKRIQQVDTPVRVTEKNVYITEPVQPLRRYTLSCGFFFSIPKNILVSSAGQSAEIQYGKNTLKITCVPFSAKSPPLVLKNVTTSKAISIEGPESLLKNIEGAFNPQFKEYQN